MVHRVALDVMVFHPSHLVSPLVLLQDDGLCSIEPLAVWKGRAVTTLEGFELRYVVMTRREGQLCKPHACRGGRERKLGCIRAMVRPLGSCERGVSVKVLELRYVVLHST